jgi:hypothetical protein
MLLLLLVVFLGGGLLFLFSDFLAEIATVYSVVAVAWQLLT